jgi:hypothetical protein
MAMNAVDPRRRDVLLGLAALMTGCSGGPLNVVGADGPPAPAPDLRVGDRWVYRVSDGFRSPVVWDETWEILETKGTGATVRVTNKGATINFVRTEEWLAPGIVARGTLMGLESRRFDTPLTRFQFPLTPGATWRQRVDNFNENTQRAGRIEFFARVGGWKSITVPGGTFDAIFVNMLLTMDDEEFWRWPTSCNYALWWAPAVGMPIQEQRDAEYRERGNARDTAAITVQNATIALTSYSRKR